MFYKDNNKKINYPFMASTVSTLPLSISLSIFSIPFFKVKVDEGQPLHAPCNITLTVLLNYMTEIGYCRHH